MLVRYWQAAILVALMALAGNAARAQESFPEGGFATGYAPPDCCKQQSCPAPSSCPNQTNGNILKVNRDVLHLGLTKKCACGMGDNCCGGKCVAGKGCACCEDKESCACCKSKDCECCKEKKCACGKDKEGCACCKGKECCKGACKCCAAKGKQTKKVAVIHGTIIVHVPVPMLPAGGGYPMAAPCMIHPGPVSAAGCAAMPLAPPPPMLTPPGLPVPALASPVMPPQTVVLPAPTACCPCPGAASPVCVAPTNAGLSLDNCLSILGAVSDLCCAHLHPSNLPLMCLSSLGMLMDLCPQSAAPVAALPPGNYLQHPPQYIPPAPPFPPTREVSVQEEAATLLPPPRPECPAYTAANPLPPAAPVMPCTLAKPAAAGAMKVRIAAKPYSDQLEMSVGDDSCMSCKRMVVKVGESEVTLTRIDGQVRVRGEELKVKADCVGTDRKGNLILEGNVVLSYKKDGQSARVSADHIELDLATGSVTVKAAGKSSSYRPIRYDRLPEGR